MTLPSIPLTVTVVLGSPLPLIVAPSALSARSDGAEGAVVSPATTGLAGDTLPAASLSTTLSVSPLVCGVSSVTWKLPSAPTLPVPITLPLASLMVTVALGSPLPLTIEPSGLTCSSEAAAGPVVSPATTVAGGETWPAASLRVTCSVSPLVCGVPRLTWKLPSAPTVLVPSTLPAASLTVTVVPPWPLPVSRVPAPLTARPLAAPGAAGGES
ncbi:hypothetical protein PSSY5922_30460 [Pseudomonas synxantha]